MARETLHTVRRQSGNRAAILFLHGYGGDIRKTWQSFPDLLAAQPGLAGFDVHCLGYETSLLAPDIRGFWSADPDIPQLATQLRTRSTLDELRGYEALVLIAHSMGGLVVQRALLDSAALGVDELAARTSHVFLFGTPSGGLVKAALVTWLRKQLGDMAAGSEFIDTLRAGWDAREASEAPLTCSLHVIAGDRDEFVPASSSLKAFDAAVCEVTEGGHLEMVKPESAEHPSVQVVVSRITGDASGSGPWSAARVAIERREFARAVELLPSDPSALDPDRLVDLALALDGLGRGEEAIVLLSGQEGSTDLLGVLGGRLKRRYLTEFVRADGESAQALYATAYACSVEAEEVNHAQAYYHAINLAFLSFLLAGRTAPDRLAGAREHARVALTHCAEAPKDAWCLATEGEAHLYLGDPARALKGYAQALERTEQAWQAESMYRQASWVAHELGDKELVSSLDRVFGRPGS
jgi:pimeloyl-ACP methyl ester carboxylesterase